MFGFPFNHVGVYIPEKIFTFGGLYPLSTQGTTDKILEFDGTSSMKERSQTLGYTTIQCGGALNNSAYLFGGKYTASGTTYGAVQKYNAFPETVSTVLTGIDSDYDQTSTVFSSKVHLIKTYFNANGSFASFDGTTFSVGSTFTKYLYKPPSLGALDKIYAFGGAESTVPYVKTVWSYDGTTVVNLGNLLPQTGAEFGIGSLNSNLYLFGGYSYDTNPASYFSTVQKWTGTALSTESASFTFGVSKSSANKLGSKLYCLGGWDAGYNYSGGGAGAGAGMYLNERIHSWDGTTLSLTGFFIGSGQSNGIANFASASLSK